MQVNTLSAAGVTMLPMGSAYKIITIHSAQAQRGCGACLHDGTAPICRALLGEACLAPLLSGAPADLQRVMVALGRALGFAADVAEAGAGVVRSLSVLPGEVDLRLSAGRHGGGAALADAAFQALRGLLPDTDIYVRNAA